jgi:phosphotriesterase-related protein
VAGYVMTGLGPIEPERLGVTLMHEHVFVDLRDTTFLPPDEPSLKQYEFAEVDISFLWLLRRRPFSLCRDNCVLSDEDTAVHELEQFVHEGGSALVDCTMPGIGRDPRALRRIAQATGVHIVEGTGAYVERAHPAWVESESADELATRFAREITEGIDDTGVRAGVIGEIGTSGIGRGSRTKVGDFTPAEEKVLRAAARASRATGAAVTVHLDPRGQGAYAVCGVLLEEGVTPDRIVMGHMDANPDLEYHLAIAEKGVYVEYDHFGREYYAGHFGRPYPSDERRIELLGAVLAAGFESQLLLSQDVCAKIDLRTYGGVGYAHILGELLPDFRRAGVTDDQIRRMLVDNPRDVLTLGGRSGARRCDHK